ncbi:MAG TPA: AAA family ATPase [Sphaerochaeta sp.]|mgnify:CR=1 FL=1|jgi:predicted kinase|nr:AAA family ATPase [Sphaerochaeta sp.]
MVILLAGLPGSGKSYFAKQLVKRFPEFLIYNKDVVRQFLFPDSYTDYSAEQNSLCIDIILSAIGYLHATRPGQRFILDGRTFSKRQQVEQVTERLDALQIPWLFVNFECSDEHAKRRIEGAIGSHEAVDRDYGLYLRVKEGQEPLTVPHLTLNTDDEDALSERIERFLAYLREVEG